MAGHRPWREIDRKTADPYCFEVRFTAACKSREDAAEKMDQLIDHAEGLGLLFEGGHAEAMNPGDVIPGSPLDKQIRA